MSSGMVILVGVPSTKISTKKQGPATKTWAQTVLLSCPVLSEGLDVPTTHWSPCAGCDTHLAVTATTAEEPSGSQVTLHK